MGIKRNFLSHLNHAAVYIFISAAALIAVFPVLYTFLDSFKSNQELLTSGVTIFPKRWVLSNYEQAWTIANFKQYTWNSVYMSFFIVIGSILSSTAMGYVFSRGNFFGKDFLFGMMISTMFISIGSLVIFPQFQIAKALGLSGSLWGVILIRVLGMNVTNVFVSRGYINTISKEIDEAAIIDGCSFFGIFRRIIFPLLKPLIGTVGLLSFKSAWNDYLLPLVFTMGRPSKAPLIVGVVSLKSTGEAASNWNLMLAGTILSVIPLMIVYIIFSRQFVTGLTGGAVKG